MVPIVELQRIEKRYGAVAAVDRCLLHAGAGSVTLIGHNGAGKTTLFKMMLRALAPDVGQNPACSEIIQQPETTPRASGSATYPRACRSTAR